MLTTGVHCWRLLSRRLPVLLLLGLLLAASKGIWCLLPAAPRVELSDYPADIHFTADSQTLVGVFPEQIKFYEVACGKERGAVRCTPVPGASIPTIKLSSNGGFIAAMDDGRLKIWRLDNLKDIRTFEVAPYGHFEFSPDSRLLVYSHYNRARPETACAYLWEIETGKEYRPAALNGACRIAPWPVFSPDGRHMVFRGHTENGPYRIWDFHSQESREILLDRVGWLGGARFSPNGQCLLFTDSRDILVVDIATGKLRTGWSLPKLDNVGIPWWQPTFSFDGRMWNSPPASGSFWPQASKSQVLLWDTSSGEKIATLEGISWIDFDREGLRMLGEGWRKAVVYDTTVMPPREIYSVVDLEVIRPDDQGSAGSTSPAAAPSLFAGASTNVCQRRSYLSPNGKLLAISGSRKYRESQLASLVHSHLRRPSADGERGKVLILDAATGRELCCLPAGGEIVFSPDSGTLLVHNVHWVPNGNTDPGKVVLWSIPPDKAYPWLAAFPFLLAALCSGLVKHARSRNKTAANSGDPQQPARPSLPCVAAAPML